MKFTCMGGLTGVLHLEKILALKVQCVVKCSFDMSSWNNCYNCDDQAGIMRCNF